MTRNPLIPPIVALVLLLCTVCAAQAADDRVEIDVERGSIAGTGDRASLDLVVVNEAGVRIRLVGLTLEYDTPTGDTLVFESHDDLDLTVPAVTTVSHTGRFATEYAEGIYVDWPSPYTVDAAIGADIGALRALAESAGDRPDRVATVLGDVNALAAVLRRSHERFPERLGALAQADAWFDADAVEALRTPLEESLCAALGRRVARTRASEARVEAYRSAASQLGAHNLYSECMGREARLAAARALVATNRAQDALVLTERDDAGEVLEEWRELYIQGRVALAEIAIDGEAFRQFRTGIESLGEVLRLDPDNRRLGDVADRLLSKAARHTEQLIAEERELDALQMAELMRQSFAAHPQTERASLATANALLGFARRSLDGGHPIRANNAWVRGLAAFGEMPVWQEVGPQIQSARRDYYLTQTREALDDGRLDDADEALREATQLSAVDPEVRASILNEILLARWTDLDALVDAGSYEDAMSRADALLAEAEQPESLGEARSGFYMSIAEAVWDHYGMLAGIASRTRLGLAEEALDKGRDADPELADTLATRFFVARWLFPAIIAVLFVLAALVFLLRGSWRKRRKARKLWHRGVARAEHGDAHEAAQLFDRAWTILETDDHAAVVVGEESRGHLVLQMAAIEDERGRKDKVDDMRTEWRLLEEWERPFDDDFDQALEQFRA